MILHSLPPGLYLHQPSVLLATWFGTGLLPKAPGTWGSLAALPFAWFIASWLDPMALITATGIVFLTGCWAASIYVEHSQDRDPGPVVIDEVAGQWLTLAFVPPDLILYALGFVLFRIADIFKPWPASWADRQKRSILGVMLDDIFAALYAGLALWLIATYGLPLVMD